MIDLLANIDKPFIPGWSTPGYGLRPFAAEMILIGTIVAVLLAPFFARKSNITTALITLLGLAIAFLSVLVIGISDGVVGTHFRGMMLADPLSVIWKGMLLLFVIGVVLMWFCSTSYSMHEGDGPEFFTLLLGATLGMMLMSGTTNLLMIVMAVELASYPSYVLAGFRKTHRLGAEASLKYVLFGAGSSSVMIFGLSLLYGLYGTLQLETIAAQVASQPVNLPLLCVAVLGLIVGLGFKISAVPFHLWCPDVFEGANIDVSAFLSVASKGAGLVLLMRVVMTFAQAAGYQAHEGQVLTALAVIVGSLGAITATVGNTGAYVQNNIKRLLAYSSIAHAGYMLCVLSLLIERGQPMNQAIQALVLYLLVYLFMNLGAFTVAAIVYRHTGSEDLAGLAGLGRRSPLLAGAMFACLISLIGLPPFAGFIAKVFILWSLMSAGSWWWILVIVIGVNTIISAFYYFRIIKSMYLASSDLPEINTGPLGPFLATSCAVILLFMMIAYAPVGRLTERFGQIHFPTAAQPVASNR